MRMRTLLLTALLPLALVACQTEERTTVTESGTPAGETAITSTPPIDTALLSEGTPQPTATVADAETATSDLPPMMSSSKKPTPKTHTADHGGVMHMPGAENAKQKCAMCHGPDLKGGKVASTSCYECHEAKWKT